MAEFKVFVASSMTHKLRGKVCDALRDRAWIEDTGHKIDLVAFSNQPSGDTNQRDLNSQVETSDIFILLTEDGELLREKSVEEYRKAQAIPKITILAFCLLKEEDKTPTVLYQENGQQYELEQGLLKEDCYLRCIPEKDFVESIKECVKECIKYPTYTQSALNYGSHLHNIGQGMIRENNERYYRREKLDGAVERIFENSPIAILEGNTYSGKTRAAFELMKRNEEWKDCKFHIFDNRHKVADLNYVRLSMAEEGRGHIYLFDDINDIVGNDGNSLNRTGNTLWSKLNGYNEGGGFAKGDFGNNRVIITVSGRLSAREKRELYQTIFHTDGAEFYSRLNDIIVDFDIYDRNSFKELVEAMVRGGALTTNKARRGNYTVGSLFIRTDDIREKVKKCYEEYPAFIKTLAGHYLSAGFKSKFTGDKSTLLHLFDFILNNGTTNEERFDKCVDFMRKNGLLTTSDKSIYVDRYIVDAIYESVWGVDRDKEKEKEKKEKVNALNARLIEYAKKCQEERGGEEDALQKYHICYVTQMGYLLIDRNEFEDDEIQKILTLVAESVCEKGAKLSAKVLTEIAKQTNSKRYPMVFVSTAISKLKSFELSENIVSRIKKLSDSDADNEAAKNLYKQVVYAMLSTSNRTLTMAQERKVVDWIFDNEGSWREPFAEEDLKDAFVLARMIPHLQRRGVVDIIKLLGNVDLGESASSDEEEEEDLFGEISSGEDSGAGYNIFASQLGKAAITALSCVGSYDELITALNTINDICESREDIKSIIQNEYFGRSFYKRAVPQIVNRLRYYDRAKLFDFVFKSFDSQSTTPDLVEELCLNISELREDGIRALNNLLKSLDEGTALFGYERMIESGLSDSYTLSVLMNNDFLTFEQLVKLFKPNDFQNHYLTQNQLMDKVQTISDAEMCMRNIMGISDGDPSKLRDENALVGYLKIEAVRANKCIEIIKKRRSRFKERLSDSALTVLLKKFNAEQLVDIFCPDTDRKEGYYEEEYGLLDKEVEGMRKNAIHINRFILQAGKAYRDKAEAVFDGIVAQNPELITDPERNGNNAILSAYLKEGIQFNDYNTAKEFYNGLKCKPQKPSEDIYNNFLWLIYKDFKNRRIDKNNSIERQKSVLSEAYKNFADNYTTEGVEKRKAKLKIYEFNDNAYSDQNKFENECEKIARSNSSANTVQTRYDEIADYVRKVRQENPSICISDQVRRSWLSVANNEERIKSVFEDISEESEMIECLVKTLLNESNHRVFNNLCKRYILTSRNDNREAWLPMWSLLGEALDNTDFCEAVAEQILYLNNKQKLGLNSEDTERIEILKNKLTAIRQNEKASQALEVLNNL